MAKKRNSNSVKAHENGRNKLAKARSGKKNDEGGLWTCLDIARESGVSLATVTRFFNGKKVRRESAEAIVSVLDLNLDDLIDIPSSDTPDIESDESNEEDIPDLSDFFGRTEELATLKQWILQDRCRLITLVGMRDIGKTYLARKLKEQISDKFDRVIERSLKNAPSLNELLTSLILEFPTNETTDTSNNIAMNLAILEDNLNNNRCLLFLDDIQEILQPKETLGKYLQGYENYESLFRGVGEKVPHRSCLVILSQEKPQVIRYLECQKKVETLPIRGLGDTAAKEIFKQQGFFDSEELTKLIHLYQAHPFFLKLVATTIQKDFGGSIHDFLYQGATLDFGNIHGILDSHLQRLSDLEKEVMCVLASEDRPFSYEELRTNSYKKELSQEGLTNAITSLNSRGLIKTNAGGASYTLASTVIIKYVRRKLSN